MSFSSRQIHLILIATLATIWLSASIARATDLYWDSDGTAAPAGGSSGTTATGTWGTSNFWNSDSTGGGGGSFTTATTSADNAFFSAGTDVTGTYTVTISGTQAANGVTVEEGTAITFSGTATPALTIGAGGLTIGSGITGTTTLGSTLGNVVLSASQTWTKSTNSAFTIDSGIVGTAVAGTQTLTFDAGNVGNFTLNGVIGNGSAGGNVAVDVNTPGTALTNFVGTNTYSGGTTLTSGLAVVNNTTSAFGSGTLTLAGGSIRSTIVGPRTVTNSVIFAADTTVPDATGATALTFSGPVTLTGNRTLTTDSTATTTFSGVIDDGVNNFGLTKAGTGILALSNVANTYTGNTTISGGTLRLSAVSTNNIASSPAILIGNGATLDVTSLTAGNFSLASGQTITGTGATGTIVGSTSSSAVTMNGNNTISNNAGGTLNTGRLSVFGTGNAITAGNIQSTAAANRSLIIGNGTAGTLTISGGTFTSSSTQLALGGGDLLGNVAGNIGTLIINGGSYTNTVVSGLGFGLGNTGAGVLTLTSGTASVSTLVFDANTVDGATINLDGGMLTATGISNSGGNRTINFNGGTLRAGGSFSIAPTGYNSDVVNVKNGGAIIDTQANTVTISSNLLHFAGATTDSLTKSGSGTLTLSGANTYSGNTNISNGTLALSTAGTNNIASSPTISLTVSVAVLDVAAVGGGFSLAGSQTLMGIGTVQGNTTLGAGANLAPGLSPGTLTFANNLNVSATGGSNSGDLMFELGTTSDLVNLTAGLLTIGSGTLGFNDFAFTPITGFAPGTYTLFQTGQTISGTLDGANLSGLVGGFGASLAFANSNTDLVLLVVPEPESFAMLLLSGMVFWRIGTRKSRSTAIIRS